MKQNKDPMLRALYILLVPIVVLIIILNTGMLQRMVPAARVGGQSYSVVRYNYYYFDYYNRFLEEHETELEEIGYDPTVSDTRQFTDSGESWKAFFMREAEADMAETAYYYDLAAAAGYVFSEEELLPVQERLDEHAAAQLASGINAKNYYTAYYGAGMTEAAYTAELTRQVKAQAYQAYLIRSAEPTQAQIDAYIAENSIPDYQTLNLRVITLEAQPDRETGEVGPEQLEALGKKLDRLAVRYEAGESFEDLQAAFSSCTLGDRSGQLENATIAELPACIADGWITGAEVKSADVLPGVWLTGISDHTGYFAILDSFGGSGPEREASLALGEEALLAQAAAEIESNYPVRHMRFGMMLATA